MSVFKLAGAVTLLVASAAAAKSGPYLPAGPWVLAGEDAQCKLSREFRQDDRAAKLTFKTLPLDQSVLVIVETTGARASPPLGLSNPVLIAGDTKKLRKVLMQSFLGADRIHYYGLLSITKEEFDRLSNSLGLGLAQQEWIVGFQLPKFSDAARAFHDCEYKVLRDVAGKVGFSSDEANKIAQAAQVPMILRRMAGPPETRLAPGHDIEDEAVAAYIVSPAGQMVGCAVVQRAKAEELNARVCETWGSEPFRPAKDANGQPIKGLAFQSARW
jgi:hypothetical protein